MTLLSLLALALAMLLLAASPGPGVFAVISRALASSFSHATILIMGILLGHVVFLLLSIYGLAALAETMGDLFVIVKYLGAGYLIYLGLSLWRANRKSQISLAGVEVCSWQSSFLSGFLITLGNPKVIVFYLGFFPAFMDLNSLNSWDILAISATISTVIGSVLYCYAYAAAKTRQLFQNSQAEQKLNRTAGSVMIATGIALASKA